VDERSNRHVRLLLDDTVDRAKRHLGRDIKKRYSSYSAFQGQLDSEAKIRIALDAIEYLGEAFVTEAVNAVAAVAKDTEAVAMVREAVESILSFLRHQLDDILQLTLREHPANGTEAGVYNAAYSRFDDLCLRVRRQLDLREFDFTAPAPIKVPNPMPRKNPGGKPLAEHWDEMWASIAVALYTGDLQPKSQAEIERAMMEWLGDHDLEVGETAVRGRARQLWLKWKEAE
jgi:hypothetical protein